MESQKCGLCPRPLLMKLFSRNVAFRVIQGNVLNGLIQIFILVRLVIIIKIASLEYPVLAYVCDSKFFMKYNSLVC